MMRISLREFEKRSRSEVPARMLDSLQRYDERLAGTTGDTIFDWSQRYHLRAKSYVGVIQIPGLQVEILPKTDRSESLPNELCSQDSDAMVRKNLLYMLGVAGSVTVADRDLAGQDFRRMSMWEALVQIFSRRLVRELRRGLHHQYIYQEDNLRYVKGRILMKDQIRLNLGRSDRICVRYEEFTSDTLLNRIFKETSRQILRSVSNRNTQQLLREALLELSDVEQIVVTPTSFDGVHLDRASQRFEDLLEFCRLICLGRSPSMQGGTNECFSLLFRMDEVFESFVARFIRRFSHRFQLTRDQIHIQADGWSKCLLRTESGHGRFRLKPDLVITDNQDVPSLILDTKWKRLVSDAEDPRNGVNQADIYQLYAYANRYQCSHNILLFPQVKGATPKSYSLDGNPCRTYLSVRYVDLGFDLLRGQDRFVEQLREILLSPNRIQEQH